MPSTDSEQEGASSVSNQADLALQSVVARGAPDVNVVVGTTGEYRYVSPNCTLLFGWLPTDLEGVNESEIIHFEDLAAVVATRSVDAHSAPWTFRYRFRCADGSYKWVEATSRHASIGNESVVISSIRDVAYRHERESALQIQALADPLTGLANRSLLMDRIRQGLHRLERSGGRLVVIYLDIDQFKAINDSLGHLIGDQLLMKMAERLRNSLRTSDTLARVGGDEFVIVVEVASSRQSLVGMVNRIVATGHEDIELGNERFRCTVSAGATWTSDPHCSDEDLLREADLALYRAKDLGRNRAVVFDDELRTTARNRSATEAMVRNSLEQKTAVVEFQPIIDSRTKTTVSVESGLRVDDHGEHPLGKLVFSDVTRDTRLSMALDDLVLTESIDQIAAWRRSSRAPFGVVSRLSARSLSNSGLVSQVVEMLDRSSLPHDCLTLAFEERTLNDAHSSALPVIRRLRNAGVKVGLGDFLAGHLSLSEMRQYRFDMVTLDLTLWKDLERSRSERSVVAAMIGLCTALDSISVAKGVETIGRVELLRDLGCDRIQGPIVAPFMSASGISELVGRETSR